MQIYSKSLGVPPGSCRSGVKIRFSLSTLSKSYYQTSSHIPMTIACFMSSSQYMRQTVRQTTQWRPSIPTTRQTPLFIPTTSLSNFSSFGSELVCHHEANLATAKHLWDGTLQRPHVSGGASGEQTICNLRVRLVNYDSTCLNIPFSRHCFWL